MPGKSTVAHALNMGQTNAMQRVEDLLHQATTLLRVCTLAGISIRLHAICGPAPGGVFSWRRGMTVGLLRPGAHIWRSISGSGRRNQHAANLERAAAIISTAHGRVRNGRPVPRRISAGPAGDGLYLCEARTRARLAHMATIATEREHALDHLPGERVFLSAEWRDLVMLNYEVDPALVAPYVPQGTEPHAFDGRVFVSLVGFRFVRTKLLGFLPLPFHTNFDEVNLRFYVKRRVGGEERRGVVFIREIVPRFAVAHLARRVYNENYVSCPMRHASGAKGAGISAEYQWKIDGQWHGLRAEASGAPAYAAEGSIEQFITEHYWGYSTQRNGGCVEYRVAHVPWRVWQAETAAFEGDAESLYGAELARALRRAPDSAFIADGSPVLVFAGRRIS